MGVTQFLTSLPGRAVRVLRTVRKEAALRVNGTSYVTNSGQIRLNPNPTPGVTALMDDVYVAAATGNPVGRAVTRAATELASRPLGPVTDDIGTETALRMGIAALGKLKKLLLG